MSLVRNRFASWIVTGAVACVWFVATNIAHAAERPPNVVMLIGDDMGWTDYGFMGHEVVKTPHIDRLAEEGALFPNGYVPTSLCRASLATLLTGLYASQHKICCNDPPQGIDRSEMLPFLGKAATIPRRLKERGYESLQTGKFWEGHFSNGGFTQGMTTKGRHGDDGLVIGRQTMQPIYDFITACGEKPFFVWYAPMLPHEPHNPPQRILEKYLSPDRDLRKAKYWAMCEWFDETCGQLVNWLDVHGYKENTLIIYVVDNGWLQTNGPVRQGDQFLTRSKNTPYEDGVRTPIIFRRPGWITPGRRTELVSTIDLAPTILAACHVLPAESLPGLNLLPLIREGQPINRSDVYGEIYLHDCVELGKPGLSVTHRWIRQAEWKLIVPTHPDAAPELYHVTEDPHEKRDEAARFPERVEQLTTLLNERWNPKKDVVKTNR
ncbi:sulfatase [Schlesneria sp. T3-172]|uniref:sulfatase family protein n=1 Tax=Schlesneria sphaerica TaxID=3373610 RepID=UPI0037C7026D